MRSLFLAVLAVALCNTPLHADYIFTTIDNPRAQTGWGGTWITGINGSSILGSTIVGDYVDDTGIHGFTFNGSSYAHFNNDYFTGIAGNTIVGYNNNGGFTFNGSTYSYFNTNPAFATLSDPVTPGGINSSYIVGNDGNGLGWIYDGSNVSTVDVGGANLIGYNGSTLVGTQISGFAGGGFMYQATNFPPDIYPGDPATYPQLIQYHNGFSTINLYPVGMNGTKIYGYDGFGNGIIFDGTNYTQLNVPPELGVNTIITGVYGTTVVGSYFDSNGDSHGFVATLSGVPEPSTYALFGIGAIGMLMVLRRKKTA